MGCYHLVLSLMASSTTKTTGIRLKNEDIDVIDKMSELVGKNRSDLIRILLMPSILQAKTAMETKSVLKAAKVRMQAELEQGKIIRQLAKNAEVQGELNLVEFGEFSVQPA
jgi:propanediol dehydratase small subunit